MVAGGDGDYQCLTHKFAATAAPRGTSLPRKGQVIETSLLNPIASASRMNDKNQRGPLSTIRPHFVHGQLASQRVSERIRQWMAWVDIQSWAWDDGHLAREHVGDDRARIIALAVQLQQQQVDDPIKKTLLVAKANG